MLHRYAVTQRRQVACLNSSVFIGIQKQPLSPHKQHGACKVQERWAVAAYSPTVPLDTARILKQNSHLGNPKPIDHKPNHLQLLRIFWRVRFSFCAFLF